MSEPSGETELQRWRVAGTDQERPSMRVVDAVAAAMGVDPVALDPLYDVVDPDALDRLFASGVEGSVHFEYQEYGVVVHSDGQVTVEETGQEGA